MKSNGNNGKPNKLYYYFLTRNYIEERIKKGNIIENVRRYTSLKVTI